MTVWSRSRAAWLMLVTMACLAVGTATAHAASRRVCGPARPGHATCFAEINTGVKTVTRRALSAEVGTSDPAPTNDGYGPADLQSAYNLATAAQNDGGNATVAVVDAYNDPNIVSDLATYRSAWGLPACGTGCFEVLNEFGQASPLPANAQTYTQNPSNAWAIEESLDVDMVSAICPHCKIDLVEANSSSFDDLGQAVKGAIASGARYVSNSYGGTESSGTVGYDSEYYSHPGDVITASTGDNGYSAGVEVPAAYPDVVAVGGTSLTQAASTARGWTESAWSGAQSGCSAYEPKPGWQKDDGCTRRSLADVSADADPDTGVAIYDGYDGFGWTEVGGTSASSPMIAATYALAGTAGDPNPASYLYADPSGLFDVTSGSNGTCSPSYLCTAGVGYDGPTGLGTPDGLAAFGPTPATLSDTSAPAISGTPRDGATLRAGHGTWTVPSKNLSYAYQWEACSSGTCSAISGATKASFVPRSAQVGESIEVLVTATDTVGDQATATSAQVGPVANPAPPLNTKAPVLSGTDATGKTLKVSKGTWKSADPLTYAYAWQSCSATSCTLVSTAPSYKVTPGDAGNTIVAEVTATDGEGQSTTVSSNSVGGSSAD